jgi:hypothetical protein
MKPKPHRNDPSLTALNLDMPSTIKEISIVDSLSPSELIAPLVKNFPFEHMWAMSGRVLSQFQSLDMQCIGSPTTTSGTELIVDEPTGLSPLTAAHAWMIGLAQRGAMDLRQQELLEQGRVPQQNVVELTTVALLAGCTNPRGTHKRLTEALNRLAVSLSRHPDLANRTMQFLHAKPTQAVSPFTRQMAVPFVACRFRAIGITAEKLISALKDAVKDNEPTGEVLVLSNLWLA